MAGKRNPVEKLNKTLLFIIKLLNENQFGNWFVGYGTLLGIIRENSCIDGDDDIDIIIDGIHYDRLKEVLHGLGISFDYGRKIGSSRVILKTKDTDAFCSVDFYMAEVDEDGNFYDQWEKVTWSNCFNEDNRLIEHVWENEKIFLPCNAEVKLERRYGESWRIPRKTKGPRPRKLIL